MISNNVASGLTLPLDIVAICYKNQKVATNINHWLNVNSRWLKNYRLVKKGILTSFWIIQVNSNMAFIIPSLFKNEPY